MFSEVSSLFVSPLFPKAGEEVTVSIAFSCRPESVLFRYSADDGLEWTAGMNEAGTLNGAFLYSVKAKVSQNYFRYYFIFFQDGKSYYYSHRGISRHVPGVIDRFSLIPGYQAPGWVAGSTCYQVFPDRFFNGDPSVGAKAGEYSFDGGTVTTPVFTSVPKPFPESRCLDFYNGDLKGIAMKADYLKALGIDTIYVNPINMSMTVHRYDAVDYFHVDPKLGGDEALQELTSVLHSKGIRLIVDISINHTGTEAVWFKKAMADPGSEEAEYYYIDKDGVKYWQGVETLPQLNYGSKKLRNRIWEGQDSVIRAFLRPPYSIDGWRFDVAPEVGRAGKDQYTSEVWRGVRKAIKEENPEAYIVAESWDESAPYLNGDMWDGIMNYYGAGRMFRSWMGERDHYLTEGWGHDPASEEPWTGEELSEGLNAALKGIPDQIRYFQLNLFDSHDTPRLHNNDRIMDRETYKGVVILQYLLPGMPSTYYGDEIQLDGKLGTVEASRYPMCWDEEKWDKDMLGLYRMLGALRKEPGLGYASISLFALDDTAVAVERIWKGGAVAAVVNRGPMRKVTLPGFLLPSSAIEMLYGGEARWTEQGLEVNLEDRTSSLFKLS